MHLFNMGAPPPNPGPACSPHASLWLTLPFVAYAVYSAVRADLRVEHGLMIAAVAVLSLIGPRARSLLYGLYPFALVGLLYDGMRPLQDLGVTESRVLVCDLRNLEARLFGWTAARGGPFTLHDWFQAHRVTALDLVCAIPYATFILWCVAGTIFLYVKDRAAMKRFAWGFFALNVIGFITYHVAPAAPPWYFHTHGCAVDLATKANEGPVLARVDAILGVPYFHGMYAKASSVFGALPSLHCAYPLLLAIEGWRAFGPRMRAAAILYWVMMLFSAVYLDHHWVLDALLGSLYAVAVAAAMRVPTWRRTGTFMEATS
jgi:inositol phosphorylceramide synthase catalytic subunit